MKANCQATPFIVDGSAAAYLMRNFAVAAILDAALGQLPVNNQSSVDTSDKFVVQGFEMLNNAYALAQFFDRDVTGEMANLGMQAFQEFMVRPNQLDAILSRLETARQRIY